MTEATGKDIRVGSIVTVQLDPQKYANSKFQGKQGEVVLIADDGNKEGPVGVKFPGWYKIIDWQFFDFDLPRDAVVRFEKNELRVDERWRQPEISDQLLCDLLFGRSMWHTRYVSKEPFIPGYRECQHESCKKPAILRILVNCWGVVSDWDVCAEHAAFHGRNCEEFPAKKTAADQ